MVYCLKTVKITEDFHTWLHNRGGKGETFDSILKRLTDYKARNLAENKLTEQEFRELCKKWEIPEKDINELVEKARNLQALKDK